MLWVIDMSNSPYESYRLCTYHIWLILYTLHGSRFTWILLLWLIPYTQFAKCRLRFWSKSVSCVGVLLITKSLFILLFFLINFSALSRDIFGPMSWRHKSNDVVGMTSSHANVTCPTLRDIAKTIITIMQITFLGLTWNNDVGSFHTVFYLTVNS